MAADDAHHYDEDAVKSYLMVHAREKTHAAVMEALWAGQFYATQGPRVELTIIDQVAHVTCSPGVARRLLFRFGLECRARNAGKRHHASLLPPDAP